MAGYFHFRSAGYSSKQFGGIIYIIRDEIVRQRKMLVHRPDYGGQCVLCPGAVRPFTGAVRFGNSYGYHQYLNSLLIPILFLMISLYQQNWTECAVCPNTVYFANKVCNRAMQPYKSKKWLEQHFPGSWE
ncbi:hypothetical protein D3981_004356 [Escherichia coli]|nr:hypothetical protein [Escherichia coli]